MKRIIFCDFDGTITPLDVGNTILNHFTQGRWDDLDSQFIAGDTGSLSIYQKIVASIDAPRKEIEGFIRENFDLDEAFPSFVQNCLRHEDTPFILSDGFDIYIRILLQKRGLEKKVQYKANHWEFRGGRTFFSFPYHNPECQLKGGKCGNCKLNHLLQAKQKDKGGYSNIIYIGNGYSDRCPIIKADQVIAKDFLLDFCVDKDIACLPFRNFHDVNRILF